MPTLDPPCAVTGGPSGGFARTVPTRRHPALVDRVLDGVPYPLEHARALEALRAETAGAAPTPLKGDLNHRRLTGDLRRPATAPFAEAAAGFPGPLCALRTLEPEVVAGRSAATVARLDATGAPWRTAGPHAVLQGRP